MDEAPKATEKVSRGEVAIAMSKARPSTPFESLGVPDTKYNRQMWDEVQAQTEAMVAKGQVPMIPWDYTLD